MPPLGIAAKFSILIGLIALVALSGTGILLFRMQDQIVRQEQGFTTRLNQIEQVRSLQLEFKKQVQEWKDILLRGSEPTLLEKHLAAFREKETLVRAKGQKLMGCLAAPATRARLADFLQQHETLSHNYQLALQTFQRDDGTGHLTADRMVRGEDRPPTDTLDEVASAISADFARYQIENKTAEDQNLRLTVWVAILLFAGLLAASLWLARRITTPVLALSRTVARIASEHDYGLRAERISTDEIGLLATGFNEMLARIQRQNAELQSARHELEDRVARRTEELQSLNSTLQAEIVQREDAQRERDAMQQLVLDASHQAGMAEIAVSILHNVGNVLNSANVSATLVVDQLHKSQITNLTKAVQLLEEHKGDLAVFLAHDPKGRQLATFLHSVSSHLVKEQELLIREARELQRNIDHIKQIVATQQAYARISGTLEKLDLVALVEDALRMSSLGLDRHRIELVREFEPVPPVMADRHKVLQILVNLVRNAKDALAKRPDGRRLVLRISAASDRRVCVEVCDNGAGIAAENLTRIFNHGFTTRADGHGFGLHSGANAAREMGASLTVRSEGLGSGATFTLELAVALETTRPIARSDQT